MGSRGVSLSPSELAIVELIYEHSRYRNYEDLAHEARLSIGTIKNFLRCRNIDKSSCSQILNALNVDLVQIGKATKQWMNASREVIQEVYQESKYKSVGDLAAAAKVSPEIAKNFLENGVSLSNVDNYLPISNPYRGYHRYYSSDQEYTLIKALNITSATLKRLKQNVYDQWAFFLPLGMHTTFSHSKTTNLSTYYSSCLDEAISLLADKIEDTPTNLRSKMKDGGSTLAAVVGVATALFQASLQESE